MFRHIEIINKILSLGIIFFQVIILFLVVNMIFFRNAKNHTLLFFRRNTFIIGLLISLGGILSSFFYSVIVGYPPCELCILQRIFFYPEFIIFLVVLYQKYKHILNLGIILAVLGTLTSVYHIFVEGGKVDSALCSIAFSEGTSCAIRYVFEFGYITIPVMSLTLSLFVLVLLINFKMKYKE